ncbi:MAG TPA: benzoate/H(+) symporter BenE family transporter [Caldimonas sp.]
MLTLRLRDLSLSAATAGFIAVLIGFTSSVAIVFQAATSLGSTPAEISSWMWALGLGMGLCTVLASLWLKKPVMIAWCTPGAALLATAGGAFALNLAAITAAICMGREAHEGPDRRHMAAVVNGLICCVIGLFGAAAAGMLGAFPRCSAFWGLVAGALALFVQQWRPRTQTDAPPR